MVNDCITAKVDPIWVEKIDVLLIFESNITMFWGKGKGRKGQWIVVLRYWRSHFCHLFFPLSSYGMWNLQVKMLLSSCKLCLVPFSNCLLYNSHISRRLPCNPRTRMIRFYKTLQHTSPVPTQSPQHGLCMFLLADSINGWIPVLGPWEKWFLSTWTKRN